MTAIDSLKESGVRTDSYIVDSFPLSLDEAIRQYRLLPSLHRDTLYHYTSRAGLAGILQSGGLRASYRRQMNDRGEFEYAKGLIYDVLDEIGKDRDRPRVAEDIAEYVRINLDRTLLETPEIARSYCACLSIYRDDDNQWRDYADHGKGFAIGFDFSRLLSQQMHTAMAGAPHLVYAPVTYDASRQRDLVLHLVSAGISDLQRFATTCSRNRIDLTTMRDRITKEIVVQLICQSDFLKAPKFKSEGEIRIVLNPNDGTLLAPPISHYDRNQRMVPYILLDLRNPITGRLPLVEIMVGPSASFATELNYVEEMLDELGFATGGHRDWPRVTQSKLCAK